MAAHVDQVVQAWREWGIQALVLFSLALQVVLLVLAEFRRRINSFVLKFFIWSAYILADTTAIYVLGHLSVTSRSPRHQLMAFWAPFLLLHLGGQDNITAYAIEDNKLWLRHLQTFVVQVAAAAYVLYESSILNLKGSRVPTMLWWATVLMFVVGVVKYGERVWALRCVDSSLSAGTKEQGGDNREMDQIVASPVGERRDTESLLLMAHRLLDVAKSALITPLPMYLPYDFLFQISGKNLYRVAEMELSLMHDVLYTKAEVMHTRYGFCIRVFLTLATAVAFLLFYHHHHHHKRQRQADGYSGVDVIVTYVLLVGALVLEMISVVRAMLSSWTVVSLLVKDNSMAPYQKKLLSRMILPLRRRLVHSANWRRRFYCSGSMGQHNLNRLRAKSKASRRSKIARWMGVEDLWNTFAYSSSITVPTGVKRLLYEGSMRFFILTKRDDKAPTDLPLKLSWHLLRECLDEDLAHKLLKSWDNCILTWHIATDIYLDYWWKKQDPTKPPNSDQEQLAGAVQALSNYMLYLLASRPYMLLPTVSHDEYIALCHLLIQNPELYNQNLHWEPRFYNSKFFKDTLRWGCVLGHFLTGEHREEEGGRGGREEEEVRGEDKQEGDDMHKEEDIEPHQEDLLKQIALVWAEMLCYAGYKCSASSHAKHLSNGIELITIAALLVQHNLLDHFTVGVDDVDRLAEWYDSIPSL